MHSFSTLYGIAPSIMLFFMTFGIVSAAPICTNFTVPITANAHNLYLQPTFSLGNPTGLLNALVGATLNNVVGGTFNIAMIYCEPEVTDPLRHNTLQVLVHGATYTKGYWHGLFVNDQYSWAATASKQGYPTLAVDRLGNGDSQHPDPLLYVQFPLQAEIIHQQILQARAGVAPFPRAFTDIILVGHSLGSIVVNALTTFYPKDANATILTGYSSSLNTAIAGALAQAGFVPADLVSNTRFGNLSPGYLAFLLRFGFNALFYGPSGTFDPSLQNYDFAHSGTFALGEGATALLSENTAAKYTGPVHFMTAEHDVVFCNVGGTPLGSLLGTAGCTKSVIQYLKDSQVLYPASSNFSYYAPPTAGHCWQLSYDGPAGFAEAHQWMAEQGF